MNPGPGILGTEIHPILFAIIIFQMIMLIFQCFFYLLKPEEKGRKYFLLLVIFLLFYNITGGLFPDKDIAIPINFQLILAYSGGISVSIFFVYYVIAAFQLPFLKKIALQGALTFVVAPFVVIFIPTLLIYNDHNLSQKLLVIIPGMFSFYWLYYLYKSLKYKYKLLPDSPEKKVYKNILISTFLAQLFWNTLPIVTFLNAQQIVEHGLTNLGYIFMLIAYFKYSVHTSKSQIDQTLTLEQTIRHQQSHLNETINSKQHLLTEINSLNQKLLIAAVDRAKQHKSLETITKELLDLDNQERTVYQKIYHTAKDSLQIENNSDLLLLSLDSMYPSFKSNIEANYPNLSLKNFKHLSFLKLELPPEVICKLLNISRKSYRQTKYRLAKDYLFLDGVHQLHEILDNN